MEPKHIGLFRHNDFVVIFQDTPLGHVSFLFAAAQPRHELAEMFGRILAESNGDFHSLNHDKAGVPSQNILFVPMEWTNLPDDLPNHKIIATDERYAHPDVPTYTPGDNHG